MPFPEKAVTEDPSGVSKELHCAACGQYSKKRPAIVVSLTQAQLRKRAAVDTSPLPNPFLHRGPGPLRLCTECITGKNSWTAITDVKGYGQKAVDKALRAWRRRASPSVRFTLRTCYVCTTLKELGREEQLPSDSQFQREPSLNLQLFKVLLYDKPSQSMFCSDLSERSGLRVEDCRLILQRVAETRFCSLHHNQSRHASNLAARLDNYTRGTRQGFCVFRDTGCLGKSSLFRPLPLATTTTLEGIEHYFDYQVSVDIHSDNRLSVEDVAGKQACATCRFMISKGQHGIVPNVGDVTLKDATDRCLLDCILYALDVSNEDSVFFRGEGTAVIEANKLKSKVITPFPEVPNSRFLPFPDVVAARERLNTSSSAGSVGVVRKTIEERLGPLLAVCGIHLHPLSRKFRCYALSNALSDTVQTAINLSHGDDFPLLPKKRRRLLTQVSLRFKEKGSSYRSGDWLLSEEVSAIPRELWASFALDMACNKQLAAWKVTATGLGRSVCELFPISNEVDKIPGNELDNFAQTSLSTNRAGNSMTRADFLLVLRVFKVIEEVVYSRSRVCVGPLTMTLSIAGILETSPSWTSVLHALGVVTSYDSTASFRKQLIAEREQSERGAFKDTNLTDRVVSIQIDNFDLLPFHSMKAAGKALPMVSGTATQAIVQSRKRRRVSGDIPARAAADDRNNTENHHGDRLGDDVWLDPSDTLRDRVSFVSSLNSEQDNCALNDFMDIAFGAVLENRENLLGSGSGNSRYRRGREERLYKHQGVNFRSLLLSCFEQHGGLDPNDPALFDQDVLFVDICRMSAADTLTIHHKLGLIKQLLTPGKPGSPRFIVVCGDQPTYRMLVKIWRNSYLDARRGRPGEALYGDLEVHEWLIPMPGLFHVEKQSLYPLCKEMLHGLGLRELAACCGLSKAQVDNILKHGHARNNRTLIFSICAALMIHCIDLVLAECPDLKDSIERLRRGISTADIPTINMESNLFRCSSSRVSKTMIHAGRLIRKRVSDFFSHSPIGKHIVHTVLFTCLLPTVGFHVLSRTGHTDVVDTFWLRLNNVLHTSGHLKYQELYLFHAFFRTIMPRVSFNDLYTAKPGSMVARVPSYTAGLGRLYDRRGWLYTHLDETLEMLIIRLLKALNVLMLPYLESAGAWLLVSSRARMMIRFVTSATRSYSRVRNDENEEEQRGPLGGYDKYSVQTSVVRAMLDIMRRKGFLSAEHRNCETLRNVLSDGHEDLEDLKVQKLILDVESYGKKSAELHASAMMPDIFGPVTDGDVKEHFSGKRFKGEWTKQRQIPTAGFVIDSQRERSTPASFRQSNDPKKSIAERRHILNKLMTALTLAEHSALNGGDVNGANHARTRWQEIHLSRYLLSPFAHAYRGSHTSVRHANKSQILSALNLDDMEVVDNRTRNDPPSNVSAPLQSQQGRKSVMFYYDYHMPKYATVMADLMNQIWTRGTDGRRGNSIFNVTVLKLKHFLRPWFSGTRSQHLQQLHLHIDDPSSVIPQKRGEQMRRDSMRAVKGNVDAASDEDLYSIGFHLPICAPWTTLISSRSSRDAISSLHLFSGAVAAQELAFENNLDVKVYLYGGCFCFPGTCIGSRLETLIPELGVKNDLCGQPRDGEVIITHKQIGTNDGTNNAQGFHVEHGKGSADPLLHIPRNRVLVISKENGLQITDVVITHGESETRFVAAFHQVVLPMLREKSWCVRGYYNIGEGRDELNVNYSSVILSKDTDVTMILAVAEGLHGKGVIHVLGERVINIDILVQNLNTKGIDFNTLACVYVLAGCDFSAGTYGVTNEHYLRAAIRHKQYIGRIGTGTDLDVFDVLTLLAYLEKHGIKKAVTAAEREELIESWSSIDCDAMEVRRGIRELFTSPNVVSSEEWGLDVRRYIADGAKTASELVPSREHVYMQARRARLIVFKYWAKSHSEFLSPEVVGGCTEADGFSSSGEIVLEREVDVKAIEKRMQEVTAKCRCKGHCDTRRCSCVKRGMKCVGCECDVRNCRNKVTESHMSHLDNSAVMAEEGVDEAADSAQRGTEHEHDEEWNPFNVEAAVAKDFDDVPALNTELDIEELLGLFGEE